MRALFEKYFSLHKYELISYTELDENNFDYVLKMRNHSNVRKWMSNTKVISNNKHINFKKNLINPSDRLYFLAYKNREILGSISFIDITKESSEFGIYKNPFSNSKGIGKILIIMAINYAKYTLKIKKLNLIVHEENKVANKLYINHGFEILGKTSIDNKTFLKMTKLVS